MTVANPKYKDLRFNADNNAWEDAKAIIGKRRVLAGPQLSQQLLDGDHWVMVGARYRAAAALIGGAESVLEVGCGEGIGAGILAKGRRDYTGYDTDRDAFIIAAELARSPIESMVFVQRDVCVRESQTARTFDAIVSLDVIEHIPADRETDLMTNIRWMLGDHGVCVVGSPSANAAHLASPQSQAGHINLYTPDRLKALMARHFHTVQFFGMQDTALHTGHMEMSHYLLAVGIGPRR